VATYFLVAVLASGGPEVVISVVVWEVVFLVSFYLEISLMATYFLAAVSLVPLVAMLEVVHLAGCLAGCPEEY